MKNLDSLIDFLVAAFTQLKFTFQMMPFRPWTRKPHFDGASNRYIKTAQYTDHVGVSRYTTVVLCGPSMYDGGIATESDEIEVSDARE